MKSVIIKLFVLIFLSACGGKISEPISQKPECDIQNISTGFEFTWGLDDARRITQSGKTLALGLDWIILQEDNGMIIKRLRPDAEAKLDEAIKKYPDVFLQKTIYISTIDEIFWNYDPTPSTMTEYERKRMDLQAGIDSIKLVRKKLPHAKIGILAPPEAWIEDPNVLELYKELIPHLDWTATDIYFWTTHPEQVSLKLKAAKDFQQAVRTADKEIPIYMAMQGFAPVDWDLDPTKWDPIEKQKFSNAMKQLFAIIEKDYTHAVIWAWNGWPDLPTFVFGYKFTDDVRQIYVDGLKTICKK